MGRLNLKEANPDEVLERLKELREEFTNLDEGRRAEIGDDGLRAMIDEVNELDTFLTMSSAIEEREARRVKATAATLLEDGTRSLGEIWGTDDMFAAVARSNGVPFEQSFEGDEGRRMSRWLRAAGIMGSEGIRAVTEWGSSGPPAFDPTDAGGLLPRLGQPIAPMPRQAKLYLRDLLPSMPTTFPTVPYVRELNPVGYEAAISGGATTVAEGSTKPTAQLSFVSVNAPVSVVAATLTLSKQMFQDAPAVIAYVNQRLPYLVKLAEDAQFLNGNGSWPNITGITNTSGILSDDNSGEYSAGDYAPQIGNAFAKVENQDGVPTAVVMNPTDAWTMFVKRAAGGSGTFDAGTPFSALPLTVWGVPTYRSRVYAQGSALVGDFERGAMVADREQVNLQTYNERYAEQNLVLLICEERVGLLVPRPDLFCETTLA